MKTTILTCLVILAPNPCLWDYDTLREERAQFPGTLELITGKFVRHSKPFYEWRVKDRSARLKSEPDDLALYDDLAVALDKVGRHDEAIATMLKKETLAANKYETAANLGTFHIHAGNLEEGLTHIDRAIQINPDAHFGREVYQKLLVEYVLENREEGKTVLPVSRMSDPRNWSAKGAFISPTGAGFGRYVLEKRKQSSTEENSKEIRKALKGIQGMMRFGHYDSPVLLEALGMLLMSDPSRYDANARRLATRAFLKASYEAETKQARSDYRMLAQASVGMQTVAKGNHTQIKLSTIEQQFKKELREADNWFDQGIVADEVNWIESGQNADELFDVKYRNAKLPAVAGPASPTMKNARATIGWLILALLATAGALAWLLQMYLRRRQPRETQSA